MKTILHSAKLPARSIVVAAVFAAAVLGTACATTRPSGGTPAGLAQQVAAARTAADHEALADRYERDAAMAKARAQDHRALSQSYQSGVQYPQSPWIDRVGPASSSATGMPPMPQHCEALAERADADARTYTEMAEQHRALARQMKP